MSKEDQVQAMFSADDVIKMFSDFKKKIKNIPLTGTDGNQGHWYREPKAIIDDALTIIDEQVKEITG